MKMKYTPLLADARRILVHTCQVLTPKQIEFWQRLRLELRAKNYELLMLGYYPVRKPMDVPYLRVRYGLDAFRRFVHDETWGAWHQDTLKFNEEQTLQRDRLWSGVEHDENQKDARRRAIRIYGNFYASLLNATRPALTVVWNGTNAQEVILTDLCKPCKCPVAYIERGPFAETIFLDKEGILFDSSIAKITSPQWRDNKEKAYWNEVVDKRKKAYHQEKTTWWEQSENVGPDRLRKRLKITPDTKVLMFAGQIDRDAQNFFYSPHFDNNLAAFKWFCDALPVRGDIFILGKHHPKSKRPIKDYQRIVAKRGAWLANASLYDCLALSDRVAAVNSTVLFEALLMEKPVLLMGQSILSNKNIAYEVKNPKTDRLIINQWLSAEDFKERYRRWLDFGAFYLLKSLYTIRTEEKAFGQNDSSAMAVSLIEMAKKKNALNYDLLAPFCFIPGTSLVESAQQTYHKKYFLRFFSKIFQFQKYNKNIARKSKSR